MNEGKTYGYWSLTYLSVIILIWLSSGILIHPVMLLVLSLAAIIFYAFEIFIIKKVTITSDKLIVKSFFSKESETLLLSDMDKIWPSSESYKFSNRHTYHSLDILKKDGRRARVKLQGIMWFDKRLILKELEKHVYIVRAPAPWEM